MAQRLKIAFIKAHWYANIVEKALDGFVAEMKQSGQQAHLVTYDVPGAFEIPLLAQRLAQTGAFDAVVGAAFVVDGGMYHADFVSQAAVTGLMETQLKTGVPMFSVILTPHSFDGSEKQTGVFAKNFRSPCEACSSGKTCRQGPGQETGKITPRLRHGSITTGGAYQKRRPFCYSNSISA